MKLTWTSLKQMVRGVEPSRSDSALEPGTLTQIARGIMTTRDDELGCAECFELVDQFVEMELAGKNAAEALPLVQDHLDRCGDCQEEFEALRTALKAMQ